MKNVRSTYVPVAEDGMEHPLPKNLQHLHTIEPAFRKVTRYWANEEDNYYMLEVKTLIGTSVGSLTRLVKLGLLSVSPSDRLGHMTFMFRGMGTSPTMQELYQERVASWFSNVKDTTFRADFDKESGMWCVFGAPSEKCYEQFTSKHPAMMTVRKYNEKYRRACNMRSAASLNSWLEIQTGRLFDRYESKKPGEQARLVARGLGELASQRMPREKLESWFHTQGWELFGFPKRLVSAWLLSGWDAANVDEDAYLGD
jgi:hypothetical protein